MGCRQWPSGNVPKQNYGNPRREESVLALRQEHHNQHPSLRSHPVPASYTWSPMRPFEDTQRRWTLLFNTSIGVDLRQALRDDDGFDPCEDGLRSVCWKAFLLYGPLSQGSWSKKLAESRSAYSSLRDHFLRFIEHPNDLHSTTDPLADDDNSPWSTLRQDEVSREEIFQDVTRCMQENYFFREPTTQKKLLDILFIYAKLNPDTGYRQGMHELIAPILWIVQHDAVDKATVPNVEREREGSAFMLEAMDHQYVEHDAFSLFCAVMQNAKAFYEVGANGDSSPIIARSRRIHDDMLAAIDPELALHLQVVGILPQIYSIRWIRLLFGREFDFKDVLQMWDLLFAENLRSDVIDLTCVAMLLRARWMLLEADYTAAITALTHFQLPRSTEGPRSLVKDALYLDRNRNAEAGAVLIERYSGKRPKEMVGEILAPPKRPLQPLRGARTPQHRPSPNGSPARFSSTPRQFETVFHDVSGGIQRRTEGWNVSKAVRNAMGEVRRNVTSLQSHSRQTSADTRPGTQGQEQDDGKRAADFENRLRELEKRNKALANMLEGALETLRSTKPTAFSDHLDQAEQNFNLSLAKIQFVSVYLADPEIPIPTDDVWDRPSRASSDASPEKPLGQEGVTVATTKPEDAEEKSVVHAPPTPTASREQAASGTVAGPRNDESQRTDSRRYGGIKSSVRPSLTDSPFSFMLGEDRHGSGFVSSAADPSTQRGGGESRTKLKQLWAEATVNSNSKGGESEDGGFTLSKLHGGHGL